MTYGTKALIKKKKKTGELTFSTGKRVFLNSKECAEFESKIVYWQSVAVEQYIAGRRAA